LLSRPAPPPLHVPLRERLLALLTRDGLSVDDAFVAVTNAGLVSIGLTLVELSLRDSKGESSLAARFKHLKASSAKPSSSDEEPLSREAIKGTACFDLSDNFDAAVRAFVAGVAAGRSVVEPLQVVR
jgi:hypothetical protein